MFTKEKEKPGLLESGSKPADNYVYGYLNNIDYAFDVTVVSPYTKGNLKDSSLSIGITAEKGVYDKYKKYQDDIVGVHWKFSANFI